MSMEGVDAIIRKVTSAPEEPTRGLSGIPIVRAFFRDRPQMQSESIDQFYEQHKEAEQTFSTLRDIAKRESADAARKYTERHMERLISRPLYTAVANKLSDYRAEAESIRSGPGTREEKASKIDVLAESMMDLARAAIGITPSPSKLPARPMKALIREMEILSREATEGPQGKALRSFQQTVRERQKMTALMSLPPEARRELLKPPRVFPPSARAPITPPPVTTPPRLTVPPVFRQESEASP